MTRTPKQWLDSDPVERIAYVRGVPEDVLQVAAEGRDRELIELFAGRIREAMEWAELHPHTRSRILISERKHAEALKYLYELFGEDPSAFDADMYLLVANLLKMDLDEYECDGTAAPYALKDMDLDLEQAESLLNGFYSLAKLHGSKEAYLSQARFHHLRENDDEALRLLGECIELPEAQVLRCLIGLERGNNMVLSDLYELAMAGEEAALVVVLDHFFKGEDWENFCAWAKQAIVAGFFNEVVHYWIFTLNAEDQLELARELCELACEQGSGYASLALGGIHDSLDEMEEAERCYKVALARGYKEAMIPLKALYLTSGRHEELQVLQGLSKDVCPSLLPGVAARLETMAAK